MGKNDNVNVYTAYAEWLKVKSDNRKLELSRYKCTICGATYHIGDNQKPKPQEWEDGHTCTFK
jgi:hypothetical protein